MPSRIAVLASGRGSNFRALLDHLRAAPSAAGGAAVVLALSDRADAGALVLSRERGVAAETVDGRDADGAALLRTLEAHDVDLVVLAGYLKLVPARVVARYRGHVVNVHPALLPAFGGAGMYGLRVHRAVLAAGARVTGATVHFVDEAYDRGAIIAQWPVPVYAADTAESVAARVLRVEHLLLPRVVAALADGRLALGDDGRVTGAYGRADGDLRFALIAHGADAPAPDIDAVLAR
jgi:phosphoribosylglycinamide formyltransferase 1